MAKTKPQAEPKSFPLAILMYHTGKLLEDRLRTGFEGIGLHPSQGRVLHQLEREDGLEQRELASRMKVSAPTMSGILKRMEAKGLVERRSHPSDERVMCVFLTRTGRRKGKVARAVVAEVEQLLVSDLSRAQLRAAHSLLRHFRDQLGGVPPGPEPSIQSIIP